MIVRYITFVICAFPALAITLLTLQDVAQVSTRWTYLHLAFWFGLGLIWLLSLGFMFFAA